MLSIVFLPELKDKRRAEARILQIRAFYFATVYDVPLIETIQSRKVQSSQNDSNSDVMSAIENEFWSIALNHIVHVFDSLFDKRFGESFDLGLSHEEKAVKTSQVHEFYIERKVQR